MTWRGSRCVDVPTSSSCAAAAASARQSSCHASATRTPATRAHGRKPVHCQLWCLHGTAWGVMQIGRSVGIE